jgi:protocatechuate 3,4-dioxygenase beta subunit
MHNDDDMIGRLLTRRELVALFGSSAVAAMAHGVSGQVVAPQSGAVPGSAVPGCVVQPQQTEGPYFVDEKSRRSDIRSDLSTGVVKPGAVLGLTMKVSLVTADGKCAPLPGAQVDLWQCDAMGAYSDVKDRLFDTTGQKFLRGHQITDELGAVTFVTIYPGWYPGRAVHLHFKVRTSPAGAQAYEFTSQFYFDEQLTDRVHARDPYVAHTGQRMRNENDGIFKNGGSQLILPVTQRAEGYAAAFDLAMRPGDPPPAGRGRRGGRGQTLA